MKPRCWTARRPGNASATSPCRRCFVAISNRRLIAADANAVTFKYKGYRVEGAARFKTMTLATAELIGASPGTPGPSPSAYDLFSAGSASVGRAEHCSSIGRGARDAAGSPEGFPGIFILIDRVENQITIEPA